jgi:hypothetical protein
MKRLWLSLATVLLIAMPSTNAFAFLYDRVIYYYSDGTFTDWVGTVWEAGPACPDDDYGSEGETTNYRRIVNYSACGYHGSASIVCQVYDPGTGFWNTVSCP